MKTYLEKPLPKEAMPLNQDKIEKIVSWLGNEAQSVQVNHTNGNCHIIIKTIEGNKLIVRVGDWIIKSPTGILCSCSPDIFKENFSPTKGNA